MKSFLSYITNCWRCCVPDFILVYMTVLTVRVK
jgi:hypothetical protein